MERSACLTNQDLQCQPCSLAARNKVPSPTAGEEGLGCCYSPVVPLWGVTTLASAVPTLVRPTCWVLCRPASPPGSYLPQLGCYLACWERWSLVTLLVIFSTQLDHPNLGPVLSLECFPLGECSCRALSTCQGFAGTWALGTQGGGNTSHHSSSRPCGEEGWAKYSCLKLGECLSQPWPPFCLATCLPLVHCLRPQLLGISPASLEP